MTFQFRPAVREQVGLIVCLAGGTGSGKTYTAMRLASGIAGDKPFAVIDTEAGRAKHYADQFSFDHGDLHPPFTPDAYKEAILAADAAGYPVIVVDSMSHEWAGDGGCLDMQEAELDRMAGDDWAKRDRVKMAAWIKPKGSHKKMVAKLLQIRAHLILCFRAEEKVEMKKNAQGRMEIVPKQTLTGLDGWVPICEKNLPFEATCSFLLLASKPGVPLPIKLQEQHRALFPLDAPITEESGRAIAAWAAGGKSSVAVPTERITPAQVSDLEAKCNAAAIPFTALAKAAKVASLAEILAPDFARASAWIDKKAAANSTPQIDEVTLLQRIDNAPDAEKASDLVDLARGQPFYKRVVEAFNARWAESA